MKKVNTSLHTVQIAAAIAASVAAWLLLPRKQQPHSRRVIVITGGSRGLGLSLARRFGKAGDRLVLNARDQMELERARQLLIEEGTVSSPDDVLLVPADLTDRSQAETLIEEAFQRFGRIDVLINNAGIIEVGPMESQPLSAFQRAMNTNFYAALHTTQAALPRLLTQEKRNGRRASIVNISSIGGKVPVPHLLPYVASKFALTGFSEGLHAELRLKGVRVTTVCPGLMRTGSAIQAEFTGQAEKEFRWFALGATTPGLAATSEYAANRIFNAVAAGSAEITITPQAWLAARVVGIAPAFSQTVAALANHFILPASPEGPAPLIRGADLNTGPRSASLEQAHNQG